MSFAAKKAYALLKQAVKYVFLVYDVMFQGVLKSNRQTREYIFEKLPALICFLRLIVV